MEDLIININESMKTRAQYIIHEEKLNMILNEKKDKDQVSRIAREINPDFKDKIISAVLIPRKESSNLKVHTFFDSLMYHRAKVEAATPWSFIKSEYNDPQFLEGRQPLVAFCTYAKMDEVQPTELYPWLGFVYTFPEYRGHRYAGFLFDEAGRLARGEGALALYVSTDHVGLYEKYGFEFRELAQSIYGESTRVYEKIL